MKILIKNNCEKLRKKLNDLGFTHCGKFKEHEYLYVKNDKYYTLTINEKPVGKDVIYCRKNEAIFMKLVNFYLWLKKNNPEKLKEL